MYALLAIALATATGATPAAQRFDFDKDEVVEGTNANPEGEALWARKKAQFGTLIKLRTHFRAEMLKSADNAQ